ncbi:MAG: NAD(P)-dependent oxidoreductase [bacterium]|nr:NAD(P)-dependent oxidoreductase [bacterium]
MPAVNANRLNLVTGAAGFAGSHLVKLLLDDQQKVIATDLAKAFEHPKNKFIYKNTGLDFSHPNCQVIPSDLTNQESLRVLFQQPVTHVFHVASLYDYSAPMALLEKINVQGGRNMFEIAVKHKGLQRFFHWSTCGVFGKPFTAKDGKQCNIPFTEGNCSTPKNTPIEQDQPTGTHLVNDYSVTKWKQEQIAWKMHRDEGLPLTVIRPAPLYGPGSDYGHGGIVLTVNKGLVPFIPKDTKHYITTSVHVEDIAGFPAFIAENDATIGEDYNVVDDSIISYYDFLQYIALLLGRRMGTIPMLSMQTLRPIMIFAANTWQMLEEKFKVPRVRVFEASSATYMSSSYWISNKKTKDTGYRYRYPDVREGLRDLVDWFRCVGWLDQSYRPEAAWKEFIEIKK